MARHWRAGAAGLAVLGLTLTACGGAKVGDSSEAGGSGGSGKCGTFNLAVNPWVGYEADAAVVAYVAEHDLKCKVTKKDLKEEIAWQGFGTGEVDTVLENWGHDDLKKKYITQQKTAVEAGSTGNKGIIGWYVPPWLAKAHPDITNWKNLNKYAAKFKTSESGGKGQLLDGDPSYVTNDEALVKNLKLDFKVVYAGSETALIQAYRNAEKNKEWVIGYFYEPQWFLSEVPLVKVELPAYKAGCDADAEKIACDYPVYDLDKIVSAKFAKSGSPAYDLVKKFNWTNDDQNTVAKYIAVDKMTPEAAAKKWVDANRGKVDAWIK
ncbi:glycine betaine/proline transport system substrate-binding protein [Streptomyces sp. SAI-208]|uniref:ABC transporter substrate-binding protein n=1 Tax=unclassified Streptomyces TaxID=2593676 RepID=UPI002475AE7A|nr:MULTISPECIES: ABC transporter substrate-binding protein [unclassified Streptomyces]MDH6520738.1 glycine betaine/proline transport system substrate-binding protein [Streptomyces sp. SAI-090]MDH6552956.1 glycine betaine/proline transport system substrate-binding protein [Streptomyces sp. SAI-041]MDH6572042.1 glycine betaine/proline transport system substrate-binding protein [Streptomyces sp. SAI-117]MDH6583000.1 glycine betaine/proline transport system substrate-binding protein [Streptomyces s